MPAYKDEERGTWYCSFYYTDWTGKKRKTKKRGFQKKKDAQDYEREFLAKEQASCDMKFSSLYDLYIKDMRSRLRETTIENKIVVFEKQILPSFKDISINKITPANIRKWQSDLIATDYSQTYLKAINNQLSAIFNYAITYYNLSENPVRKAGSIGKQHADIMNIWTLTEFNKFIEVVNSPAQKLAFKILFFSGCRVGELLALSPNDITEDRKIDINKTTTRKNGIDVFYDPKTTKGIRSIAIPETLYLEIKSYINKLQLENDEQIFYFTKSALNASLKRNAQKVNIHSIRVHDLRHSHVSLLIEMGQPTLLIAERLGHENVQTTLRTYAHLYPNKDIELAKELDKLQI